MQMWVEGNTWWQFISYISHGHRRKHPYSLFLSFLFPLTLLSLPLPSFLSLRPFWLLKTSSAFSFLTYHPISILGTAVSLHCCLPFLCHSLPIPHVSTSTSISFFFLSPCLFTLSLKHSILLPFLSLSLSFPILSLLQDSTSASPPAKLPNH